MAHTHLSSLPYGETYGGDAPRNYERFFVPVIPRPLGEDLIQRAALRPGERVLDVACGTGLVMRLAAERVGAAGSVAGLDLNPGMLAVARSLVPSNATPVRWYESSAESMPIPDERFEVVLCQLGLQFIADQRAAMKEMYRVLAPGGRLLFNVPRPSAFFDVLDAALERHVGPPAAQFVRAVFSMNDPAAIELMVTGAGFRQVATEIRETKLRLPSANEFLWQYIHSTPLAAELTRMSKAELAALEREVVEKWKPWASGGGLSYEQEIIVVTGRR
jgi:ubiquinone/menaquinone biosynthesis C-methylase UbiE